jgi:multiple sugar transport system substrate-binding protein
MLALAALMLAACSSGGGAPSATSSGDQQQGQTSKGAATQVATANDTAAPKTASKPGPQGDPITQQSEKPELPKEVKATAKGQARPGVQIRPVDKPTTLELWLTDWNDKTQRLFAEDLLPTFEAENPGLNVRVQFLDWRVFTEKLTAAYAGGVLPDLFQAGVEYVAPMASKGMALPLDDRVATWGQKDDFYPSTWNTVTYQGKSYGVPYIAAPQTLLVRKDMLAEAGVQAPPRTWDELVDVAKKTTKRDGDRFVVSGFNARPIWHQFVYFLWQNGGDVVDKDGNIVVNRPEAVEALQFFVNLFNEHKVAAKSGITPPTAAIGVMAADMAAMTLGNQLSVEDFRRNNPAKADQLIVADPTRKKEQVATVWTDWLAISRQTQNPDLAWRLMDFLTQKDTLLKYNETMFSLPPRKSLLNEGYMKDPQLQKFATIMEQHGRSLISTPEALDVYQIVLKDAVEDAVHGRKSPQKALDDAARQIDRLKKRRS